MNELLEELRRTAGDQLTAAVTYGGAAGGDVNMLIVLRRVDLAVLARLDGAIRRARKRNVAAVFWSEEELRNSADVFPLEFLDILKDHRVVHGQDPFAGVAVDTRNLRHQVEFEMRSKLLRLRSEWPEARGSAARLEDLLVRAAAAFRALFPHAQAVAPGKVEEAWKEPFEKAAKLRTKELRLSRAELEALYGEMHDAVSRIAAAV